MARRINMSGYDDTPPGYVRGGPDCPDCGEMLGYSSSLDQYKCPNCGSIFEAYEINDDDGDIPSGCVACGGPYPSCKTSCKMFDD